MMKVIEEREKTYGSFENNAKVAQVFKNSIRRLNTIKDPVLLEALEMICSKISRIVTGDSLYIDSWRDIAGYSDRAIEYLQRHPNATDSEVKRVNMKDKVISL